MLVNPANAATTDATLREVREAAPILGLQIQVFNAATIGEIDAVFIALGRDRPDALFVAADPFFSSRHTQLAALTARDRIPATYAASNYVAAGGLMSYGTDIADTFHQVGVYTGSILKGAKPADLPVVQSTKFEFAINLKTARALGIDVASGALHCRRGDRMRRREFIGLLGGAVAVGPLAARAQQSETPLIGFLSARSASDFTGAVKAFVSGLSEVGFVADKNVAIRFRWAEGHYDRLPAMASELVQEQVAVIAAFGGDPPVRAAKTASATIPIVFTTGGDPVADGLVASLNRSGGNATGVSFLSAQIGTKLMELLHSMVPKTQTRSPVLVEPDELYREARLSSKAVPEAGRAKSGSYHSCRSTRARNATWIQAFDRDG